MADAPQTIGTAVDPYGQYNFKLQIQGVTEGHFYSCTGMGVRINAMSYREAGVNQVVRRIPGRVEYSDITLRYGLTKSLELWTWFQTALKGAVERRNVSILMLEPDGAAEAMRWDLVNAWLADWRAAPLEAMGNEVAIESLTLVYESLQRS